MGLNIIKSNNFNYNSMNSTYMGIGNGFVIKIYHNDFYNTNFSKYWPKSNIEAFKAVNNENLSLSFTNEWEDAGGAKLGKKVTSFINGKLVKAFAGMDEKGYQPMIMTDAWTQQKMKGTQPLSIDLSFKAYNNNSIAGTNYRDIIKFLTCICSPMKPIILGNDTMDVIKRAAGGVINTGGAIMSAVRNVGSTISQSRDNNDSYVNTVAHGVVEVVNQADSLHKTVTQNAVLGRNNGNFTVELLFGNDNGTKIFANEQNNFAVEGVKNTSIGRVDWIIKSFSYTPSVQFDWDDKNKLPIPLWCDFKISLETRCSLSNKYVYDLLNNDKINIQYKDIT